MDPLSQGVFGALWASQLAPKPEVRRALAIGALSGMASDLDVLISSKSDPLLQLEFHRHFTHSIAFVPIGALICTLLLRPLFKGLSFRRAYLYSLLGFASHGVLDAFTSYGTQLLWPFSNVRVAWDSISIIDPLFTLPLLVMLVLAARRMQLRLVHVAFAWAFVYLSFGFVQRDRAIAELASLAASRGHTPLRLSAKPSIGNLWLFRGIYETANDYHADAIRVPPFGANRTYEGASLPKFDLRTLDLDEKSLLSHDIRRFQWFSDGYLANTPDLQTDPAEFVLSDFRYSMLPNSVKPLWGIRFRGDAPDTHVQFENFRSIGPNDRADLVAMLLGQDLERNR